MRTIYCRFLVVVVLLLTGILAVQSSPQMRPKYSEWSTPVNMGYPVNTGEHDVQPSISKDGLSLYFVRSPLGGKELDIWVSQREDENAPWGLPMILGSAINSASDGSPALTRDQHWLLFHSNRAGGQGGFDLMASYRENIHDDFGWQTPVNLAVLNSKFNDAGATYFEGGELGVAELYFGSNRLTGIPGAFDIYVSRVTGDGTFGLPELVPELSSPYSDQRPQISHDGRAILFQSDRPGGKGDVDIWVSTRPSVLEPWTTPINLEGVNSEYSEQMPTISSDGMALIFMSDRPGGFGGGDLWFCTRTKLRGEQ